MEGGYLPIGIEHVFVLVLENRSFDHMLGYSGITGTDAEKALGCADADYLVGVGADPGLPPRWCDGHGEHDPRRPQRPGGAARDHSPEP